MGQLIRATVHCLKTWSPFFLAVHRGIKTFKVRRDDRGFSVGDVLILQEFDSVNKRYTGNTLYRLVVYKLDGDQFGIEAGYCVLGLGPLPPDTKVECEQRLTTVCQNAAEGVDIEHVYHRLNEQLGKNIAASIFNQRDIPAEFKHALVKDFWSLV